MAAWYIFSALGFYPLCPGHPSYVLGSPLFRRATLHLTNGKTFTVFAPNNDSHNVYVRRVALNGRRHRKSYLSHEAIVQGGELRCIMSRTPWTQDDGELEPPFSLSTAHP